MDYDRELLLSVLVAIRAFRAGLAVDDPLQVECEHLFGVLVQRDSDLCGMGMDGPLLGECDSSALRSPRERYS